MPSVLENVIDITDSEKRGRLREFGSPVKAPPWTFGRGDSGPIRLRFAEPTGSDRRQFKDANTTDYGVEMAVGNLDAAPTGGTYSLEINTDASASIAYNASAATLQAALNAIPTITGQGGVTVAKYGSNSYQITWNNAGTINPQFVPDENLLEPETGIYLTTMVAGTGSTRAIQWLRLLQKTIAYQNAFIAYPVGAATVEVLVPGDATHKELVRISLDEPAYDGAMIVTLGTSQKFSIACVTNAANALNSTGFIMSDSAGTVGVWFNVAAAGTAPAAILACDRQLEVTTVGATDNRATVASKLATAINADAAFTATSNGGAVKVTLDAAGDTSDPADVNTTFTFTTIQQGTSISASVPVNSSARDFAASLGNVVNVAKTGNWQWDLTFRTVGNQSDIDVDASALFPSGYEGDLNFITQQCFKLFAEDITSPSFSPYLEIALTPPGKGSFTVYHAQITLLRDIIANEQEASAAMPDTFSITAGNLVYADDALGNDATGARQRFDRPFLTLAAAKAAATSGDMVIVRPGSYSISAKLAKAGVSWHLDAGVTITFADDVSTEGIFDDGGTAMSFTVTGAGRLVRSTADEALAFKVINCSHASSQISVTCDSVTSVAGDNGEAACVNCDAGTLDFDIREISATGGSSYGVWWANGTIRGRAHTISSEYGAITSQVTATPTGDGFVHCEEVTGIVNAGGSNAAAAMWVRCNTITGLDGLAVEAGNGNRLYVDAQKIFGMAKCVAGLLYVRTDKISAVQNGGSTTPGLIYVTGGEAFVTVAHLDPVTFTGQMMKITAGTLNLNGGKYTGISGSDGFEITGGAARINGTYISTLASATDNPITKSGGTLRLFGVGLVAEGTRDSMSAPTAQTVFSWNSVWNRPLDADVTLTGAGNTEDTNFA